MESLTSGNFDVRFVSTSVAGHQLDLCVKQRRFKTTTFSYQVWRGKQIVGKIFTDRVGTSYTSMTMNMARRAASAAHAFEAICIDCLLHENQKLFHESMGTGTPKQLRGVFKESKALKLMAYNLRYPATSYSELL